MDENQKVFYSKITRAHKPLQNNLYSLINVIPAVPIIVQNEKEDICDFMPKMDKQYVPKKISRLKVKTLRDIRNIFENDVYIDLPNDLEKQRNILLRKITGGSSRDEKTKTLAKNMLKSDKPVSRSAWQMIMNLNPEEHAHCIQYVLWNGQRIRVNGSKGGKNKFLRNYDLASRKKSSKNAILPKKKTTNKNKALLLNSLNVKFKPGPLTRKMYLDDSYQKYNVGGIKLVNLPKPGLQIQPSYGVSLEPKISNYIENFRNENGKISEKWAEFAVSVLGTTENKDLIQNINGCGVTFPLNYKCDQQRILMRQDLYNTCIKQEAYDNALFNSYSAPEDPVVYQEIETIMNNILETVGISLQQNNMYFGEDEPRDKEQYEQVIKDKDKDKNVKKRYCELDRLDVTVIRLPEVPRYGNDEICQKSHCLLGCICASLQSEYKLKNHCGRIECMFECKCDFSKYRNNNSFDSDCPDLLPGLLHLDKQMNLRLAKEEQKFHQTVVMTGEKTILLKPEKRNWKATKRYADFYSKMCLKGDLTNKRVLSVVDVKLNFDNVEPLCMIHNLYKCFCRGKFTETSAAQRVIEVMDIHETTNHETTKIITGSVDENKLAHTKLSKNLRWRSNRKQSEYCAKSKDNASEIDFESEENYFTGSESYNDKETSARIRPYQGRKFYDSYYLSTNKKIFEMEKNDSKLQKKILSIVGNMDNNSQVPSTIENVLQSKTQHKDSCSDRDESTILQGPTMDIIPQSTNTNNTINETSTQTSLQTDERTRSISNLVMKPASKLGKNKTKLIAWLETSYKQYKQRLEHGIVKMSLDPPKHGKVALYPWDFILCRYRERKNLFLISKQTPFRIFMAIDGKNDFFKNCINIDDIRFADLHKYPSTIKNLLTNVTDLKDDFCILCGLSHCWEFIGSVTKVKEHKDCEEEFNNITDSNGHSSSDLIVQPNSDFKVPLVTGSCTEEDVQEMQQYSLDAEVNYDSSKWFVMTVENDFSEIQFYKRGFFVKYEGIIKAINVARMSGKTVRLSSQKCVDQNYSPQFGIYAIPNANVYCVFVGPYNKNEPLGIETVKSLTDVGKPNRTRGVWITTKKMDNLKVIDNPLSFMPPTDVHPSKIVPLGERSKTNTSSEKGKNHVENKTLKKNHGKLVHKDKSKLVKPIKIRKTNGFYHLDPKTFLQQTSNIVCLTTSQLQEAQGSSSVKSSPLLVKNLMKTSLPPPLINLPANPPTSNLKNLPPPLINLQQNPQTSNLKKSTLEYETTSPSLSAVENKRPVAEIAPQIKILGIYSDAGASLTLDSFEPKKREGGMLVLKPEEINKRLMETKINPDELPSMSAKDNIKILPKLELEQDIENYLATSMPNEDIYVISDEEDETKLDNWKEVWIECKNIEKLGLIPGRKNAVNDLSFEFPGFKYTEFYPKDEAFTKINQVLSRKIYVPKNLHLEWHLIESKSEIETKHLLTSNELGTDFVLTKQGLRHKRDLIAHSNISLKSSSGTPGPAPQLTALLNEVDKASESMHVLEEQSKILDDEGDRLMSVFSKTNKTLSIANVPSQQREKITEKLYNLMRGESAP